MKRFCALLTAFALSLSLSGCYDRGGAPPPSDTGEVSSSETGESAAILETVTVSEESETAGASETLSPLEMLRYSTDEDGSLWFDPRKWEKSDDYDLFRAYFFGTWEDAGKAFGDELLVIDDSVKSNLWTLYDFYRIGGDILAFTVWGIGEGRVVWLRISEPERIYAASYGGWRQYMSGHFLYGTTEKIDGYYVLEKTAATPNEPEGNYLSLLRLHELSRDYGIDYRLLSEVDYEISAALLSDVREEPKDGVIRLWNADPFVPYPFYLLSEAPEKLVLKTTLGNVYMTAETVGAVYTLERIDGEWIRTIKCEEKR